MRISDSERRFREGKGERYMSDGITVRCQAVSKSKLEMIRQRENNPNLTPDDVWPEGQCEHPALSKKLLCGGRGGHGGGSPSVPEYDMTSFMPADMAEMLQAVMANPHLLSRRFEMQQIISRIMLLYQKMRDKEALGQTAISLIQEGLGDILASEISTGVGKIQLALNDVLNERDTYDEIFKAMNLLQTMTRTEVQSMKETRQMLGFDVVLALVNGIADEINVALEKYVDDSRSRELVAGYVASSIARRLNAGVGRILPEIDNEAIESTASSTE